MKFCNLILALLTLPLMSCDNGGSKANVSSCTLDLTKAPEGTLTIEGACPRDAEHIATAIASSHGLLGSAGPIALGRTPFGPAGAFDRCAVMAHLADDPRWTSSIDSNKADAPLRDALQAKELAPDISEALVKEGRRLRSVSLEKVLLSDVVVKDCPVSPARMPLEAQMWLLLE